MHAVWASPNQIVRRILTARRRRATEETSSGFWHEMSNVPHRGNKPATHNRHHHKRNHYD